MTVSPLATHAALDGGSTSRRVQRDYRTEFLHFVDFDLRVGEDGVTVEQLNNGKQ
jgi:hypothetical protein